MNEKTQNFVEIQDFWQIFDKFECIDSTPLNFLEREKLNKERLFVKCVFG